MNAEVRPTILLVDDEKPILDSLYRFCRQRKWEAIRAESGAAGLDILNDQTVDIIVSDMRMPNMDGAEFLSKAREKMPDAVRVLLTGYADMEAVINAVNGAKIYNYLNKPWDDNMLESVLNSALDFKQKEDERLRLSKEVTEKNQELATLNGSLEEKVKERTEKLQQTTRKVGKNFREALTLITSLIEMQDGSKANYTDMVANASVSIATALELDVKEIEQIRIAALLHNVGKFSLQEAIRKKPRDKLTGTKLETFRNHPLQGELVLSGMTGLKSVSLLVRSHQEYLNGSGYPDKLKGDAIPMGSRIICVTSDFHKLESNLLAQEVFGPEAAMKYLNEMSGKLYDARVVELFEKYFNEHLQNYRSYLSQLTLDDLQEGMILADNLVSPTGLSLLTKDSVISSEHLQRFSNYENETGGKLIFPILNSSIDELRSTEDNEDSDA